MENLLLTQDFTSLQNENVCIVVLQHKGEWMSFLTKLISRLTWA